MILVKFSCDYADEFDTNGFRIMSQSELDLMLANARQSFIREAGTEYLVGRYYNFFKDGSVESYFGTNECWSWSSYEDFMSCLEFQHITIFEARVIDNFLGTDYGMFPNLGDY